MLEFLAMAFSQMKLEKMLNEDSAEHDAWTKKLRVGIYGTIAGIAEGCIVADALGALGICTSVNTATSEATAAGIEAEIAKILPEFSSVSFLLKLLAFIIQ